MKSNIRFETNFSTESVNFLDVTVSIQREQIRTSLYTKPTDAHLYLNAKSCHPKHVVKNLPKGQFIRVRRICSEDADFEQHAREMMKFFIQRGYQEKDLANDISLVRKMSRNELLQEKIKTAEKDPQSTFVCTWHPKLHRLSAILNLNFKILQNDPKLNSIFKENPTVAFRRKKNLKNILCRNDIRDKVPRQDTCCKGCQLCDKMSDKETITNKKNGVSVGVKPGGCCQSSGVVYAIYCKKCDDIYIGETKKTMAKRWSGHKYDIKRRPDNCDFAKHFVRSPHSEKDLEVFIIEHGITNADERKRLEDKYICKLQTLKKSGINCELGAYAKEMYATWTSCLTKE